MDAALKYLPELPADPRLAKRPAYDPNNLHPLDEEDRKHDDTSEGIDWDEIIAVSEREIAAGEYTEFDPDDYPSDEACWAAIEASLNAIMDRALNVQTTANSAQNEAGR